MKRSSALVLTTSLMAAPAALSMDLLSVGGEAEDAPNSDVYNLQSHVVLDASPLAVRQVLLHICEYRERIAHLTYCNVFRHETVTAWSYSIVNAPVLDPRDYIIARRVVEDMKPDGTGLLRIAWSEDDPAGPAARKGFVRVRINDGKWFIKATPDGRKTDAVYHLRCAPGGFIPGWLAGYVTKRSVPDFMKMLEEEAQKLDRVGAVEPVDADPWARIKGTPLPKPLPGANGK